MRTLRASLFILFTLLSFDSFSQCKEAIRKATPKLLPYRFDGQAEYKIEQGKSVELVTTFTAGDAFRVMFCAPDEWKNCVFNVYEKKKRRMVFTNQIDKDYQYWDFKAKATQDYIFEIISPPAAVGAAPMKGCVAILIGIK